MIFWFVVVAGIEQLASIPAPVWAATIAAVVGGIGVKVIEFVLLRPNRRAEQRRDLSAEFSKLLDRVDKLEAEVTEWRERYYAEQERVAILRVQLITAGLVPADKLAIDLVTGQGEA